MRVIGIDPGMLRLGLACLDSSPLALNFYGLICHPRTTQTFNQYLNEGIELISNDFPRFLAVARPELIVSEIVPSGRLGSNTELVVAAITTCKVIAIQHNIPWKDIAGNTIKKSVTGNGNATKTQIRNSVIDIFPQLGDQHKALKQEQKATGAKRVGLEQDVFDAIAIGCAGINGDKNL